MTLSIAGKYIMYFQWKWNLCISNGNGISNGTRKINMEVDRGKRRQVFHSTPRAEVWWMDVGG